MRWYPSEFPTPGECVMVQSSRNSNLGVYCNLLEYGSREAMISITEITKQKVYSPHLVIPIGRIFVCSVVSIDAEKGYIDLSKKRITEDEIRATETRYHKSKKLDSLLRYLCSHIFIDLPTIYEQIWKHISVKLSKETYYDRLREIQHLLIGLYPLHETQITKTFEKYMIEKKYTIQSEISLNCFSIDGINSIIRSIHEVKQIFPEIILRYLRAPTYIIHISCTDPEKGLIHMRTIIALIDQTLRRYGGEPVHIEKEPYVISSEDQDNLMRRLSKFTLEQELISGDSDDE